MNNTPLIIRKNMKNTVKLSIKPNFKNKKEQAAKISNNPKINTTIKLQEKNLL